MAIQVSYTDVNGVTHSSAYLRVAAIRLHMASSFGGPLATPVSDVAEITDAVVISIEIYHDATARSKSNVGARKSSLVNLDYVLGATDTATYFADSVLDDNGVSPLKKAYDYIKTQSSNPNTAAGSPLNLTTGTTDV